MKIDSVFEILKVKVLSIWFIRIMSDVIIIICMMIWIESGIWLWIIEMNMDENVVIKVIVMDIMKVICSEEVIVRVE